MTSNPISSVRVTFPCAAPRPDGQASRAPDGLRKTETNLHLGRMAHESTDTDVLPLRLRPGAGTARDWRRTIFTSGSGNAVEGPS